MERSISNHQSQRFSQSFDSFGRRKKNETCEHRKCQAIPAVPEDHHEEQEDEQEVQQPQPQRRRQGVARVVESGQRQEVVDGSHAKKISGRDRRLEALVLVTR